MPDMPALQAEGIGSDGGSRVCDLLAGSTLAIQRAYVLLLSSCSGVTGNHKGQRGMGQMTKRNFVSIGDRFGRLLVVGRKDGGRRVLWICRCDCGGEACSLGQNLRAGKTTSCGCRQREVAGNLTKTHGASSGREFSSWMSMRQRCTKQTCKQWKHYGGRGISICARWSSFENFLADMGPRPPGTTLDRVNNDGNYEPGNCRWATHTEQQRNRRNTLMVTAYGETKPLIAWCTERALVYRTVHNRIFTRGIAPEVAFDGPHRKSPTKAPERTAGSDRSPQAVGVERD